LCSYAQHKQTNKRDNFSVANASPICKYINYILSVYFVNMSIFENL